MTGAGSESFTYDLNGQTLTRSGVAGGAPARNYSWDAAGRMSGDGTQSFTYDANGQRVRITAGTTVTDRVFDGGEVVQELTGSALSTTVRDGGLHSLQTGSAGATANYYRTDVNESVLALTNPAGAVARSYDYSAFGDLLGSSGSTPPNPLTLLGQQEQDPAAKTHNFNARSYDAGHGRFLSQDPVSGSLTDPQSLNPYGYGWNNPWASPDPSGLWPSLPSWHDLGNGLLSGAELIPIAGAGVSAMRYSVEHWDDKGGMPWGGLAKDIGLNLAMSVTPVGVVGKVGKAVRKPAHDAIVKVERASTPGKAPKIIFERPYRSGGMTEEQKKRGWAGQIESHTESKAMRDLQDLKPGDRVIIEGKYPACNVCKGAMNKKARETGADIEYHHPDGPIWKANQRRKR